MVPTNIHMKFYALFLVCQSKLTSSLPPKDTDYTLHDFRDYSGRSQFSISSRGDGKFEGSVSAALGTSTFDSILSKKSMEVNGDLQTRRLVVSASMEAQSVKVEKSVNADSAKFDSTVSVGESLTTKDALVRGVLNVTSGFSSRGPIRANSVFATGVMEARSIEVMDSIKAKTLIVAQDVTSDGKLTSNGGFFSKDGIMKVKDVESKNLKVADDIAANNAEFRGDVSISKLLLKGAEASSLSITNKLDVSEKGNVAINGAFACKGQASFVNGIEAMGESKMKHALVSHLEMIQQQGSTAPLIDASKGSIVAHQLKVSADIRSDSVVVSKGLKSESLTAKELQVSGLSTLGNIESKEIKTKSFEANSVIANLTTVGEKLVAKTIEVGDSISVKGNISLSENLFATNASLSNGLSAKTINADSLILHGNANVSETLAARKIQSDTDMVAIGMITAGEISVEKDINVRGSINGSSLFVGELEVGGPSASSKLGCMNVSSSSGVAIGGNVSVTHDVKIDRSLSVGSDIVTNNMSANKIVTDELNSLGLITSGPINVTHGNVTSSGGFFSSGDMMIGNVTAVGNVSASGVVSAPDIRVENHISAANATIRNVAVQSNIKVGNNASFEGEAEFLGLTVFHANTTFTGEAVGMKKLVVQTAEIQNGLDVGSLFTKRVYAQDVAATGFVTAASFISKEDVNVTRTLTSSSVSAGMISSTDVTVSNELRCSTARVDGVLEAAGINSRKVAIKGDLIVNDANFAETIRALEKRIVELEEKLALQLKE